LKKKKPKEKVYFQNSLYRKYFLIHLIKNFLEEQDPVVNTTENNERLKQKPNMIELLFLWKRTGLIKSTKSVIYI